MKTNITDGCIDIRCRMTKPQIDRLNEAAGRHGITATDLVRRAIRKYLKSGVVELPKREDTTRNTSTCLRFTAVEPIDPAIASQVIAWYIETHDKPPSTRPNPTYGQIVQNGDGTTRMVWPIGSDLREAEAMFK
jgi:hypothetical protein